MKKILLFIIILLFNFQGKGQSADTLTTLDSFFAGIPIKQGFVKWVEYLYKHPHMGLDSANARGSYSSMKPGIKSHFPFPDSIHVKILAEDILTRVPGIDTLIRHQELLIEGVFGRGKAVQKNAKKCFEELKEMFKKYYKIRSSFGGIVYYSKGINENFPSCSMQVEFGKEIGAYYILIRTAGDDTLVGEK